MACPHADQIAEYSVGSLTGDERASIDAHLPSCPSCREVVARLGFWSTMTAGAPAEPLENGRSVGRFTVLHPLGVGAMGAVYAAYDPELDRKVALKILHAADEQERLVAEARAMARLAHPNVVPALDLGQDGGRFFLAMEFVDGVTLRRWLADAPRSRREILRALTEAGRGLAAAHAAGLTHRDFKPENVLVGHDGRVRVTDFGLARIGAVPAAASGPAVSERATTPVGTPAYMAPEQLRGDRAGPKSDQFAFCVVAWEALFGAAPFDAGEPASLERLAQSVLAGRLRPASGPSWLRRILTRGLAGEAGERFASMEALLEALGRDPALRRRRLATLAVAGLTVTALFLGGYQVWHGRRLLCRGGEAKLAGIWDSPQKAAIRSAFLATHLPYAGYAWSRIESSFDGYSRGWAQMRTEACEATRLRGEQSEEVLDLRMMCLSQRLQELQAAAELFSHADARVVAKATQVATGLSSLAGCADVEALRAPVQPPRDAATRAQVELARGQIARAKVLGQSGSYPAGVKVAEAALIDARATRYLPVQAEALVQLGRLQMLARQDPVAEKTLEEALYTAQSCRHNQVAVRAATLLVTHVGEHLARRNDGYRWGRLARALLARGESSAESEASLENGLGNLLEGEANYDEALAGYRRALALRQKALGPDHSLVAATRNDIGTVLSLEGQFQPAIDEFRQALAIQLEARGPDHPDVAALHANLGATLTSQGAYQEALAETRLALAIQEKLSGPNHPVVAGMHDNIGTILYAQDHDAEALVEHRLALAGAVAAMGPNHPEVALIHDHVGNVLRRQGHTAEALASYQRALAIRLETLGAEHPRVALSHDNLGNLFFDEKKLAEAASHFRIALAIQVKALGANHPDVARSHNNLGNVFAELRQNDAALAEYRQALAIRDKALGADHPDTANTLARIGLVHLATGNAGAAVDELTRALAVTEAKEPSRAALGEIRFALARALSAMKQDPARALQLARQARDDYSHLPTGKPNLNAVDAWLAKH